MSYGSFHDLPNLTPASLDDRLQVLERLLRLSLDASLDELARRWVDPKRPRAEEQIADAHGLRVWADCRRSVCIGAIGASQ